jgi:hypothetical protein
MQFQPALQQPNQDKRHMKIYLENPEIKARYGVRFHSHFLAIHFDKSDYHPSRFYTHSHVHIHSNMSTLKAPPRDIVSGSASVVNKGLQCAKLILGYGRPVVEKSTYYAQEVFYLSLH